jgi:hypothetical protein
MVMIKTEDFTNKIATLLEDRAHMKVATDPTGAIDRKAAAVIKKSSLSEEVAEQLQPHGSRPPKLYGLPEIHKERVTLRFTVSQRGAPTYGPSKYLAGLLSSHLGQSQHHVKNSEEIVRTLDTLRVSSKDIVFSFDVVSFFTRVPLKDALNFMSRHSDEGNLRIFCHVLMFYCFNREFYEQTDGVAMGSPLSPVIANFFMEDFEEDALKRAIHKPLRSFKGVHDTFVIWSHGQEEVDDFLLHHNSIHYNTPISKDAERNGHIPFVYRDI